ncbi:unnamed protein product [Rhizophagus irregularis]|nr:unnamed protein product [Rhizophagus irregularis]
MSTFHSDNFDYSTIVSPPDALTYSHRVKGTRALFDSDSNEVLILRSNGKFFRWSLRLTRKNLFKRSGFQHFKMDYWNIVKRSRKTINASKLSKINAEIIEAWDNSDKVREIYQNAENTMSPEVPEELQLGKMKEKYRELGVRRKNLVCSHEKIPPAVDVKVFSHSKL